MSSLRTAIDELWKQYKLGALQDREFAVFCLTRLAGSEADAKDTFSTLPNEYQDVIANSCVFARDLSLSMIDRGNLLLTKEEAEEGRIMFDRVVYVAQQINEYVSQRPSDASHI